MGTYLPGAGTLGREVWSGAGIAQCRGILPDFYPPYVNVGPPVLLPLTPRHVSTLPTHLDEHGFFKSLVVGLLYSLIF